MIHPFTDEHDFRFDMLLEGRFFRLGGPTVGTMGMDMFLVQLLDLKEIRYSRIPCRPLSESDPLSGGSRSLVPNRERGRRR
jgi:hypothetical protein